MKLLIDIPDYSLDDVQNGSIACGQILKAVKNGIPCDERPQGNLIHSLTELCNRYCKNCPIPDVPDECTDCICTRIREIMRGEEE